MGDSGSGGVVGVQEDMPVPVPSATCEIVITLTSIPRLVRYCLAGLGCRVAAVMTGGL